MRRLLLLSSSKEGNSGYLETAKRPIEEFLAAHQVSAIDEVLFVPFAGVNINYDDYFDLVTAALADIPVRLTALHRASDPAAAIKKSKAILVGGGNTFHLLHQLYQFDFFGLIREAVLAGKPYIGWSAGSNIASPSIKTTNDMPIVQPPSFHALQLIPFQINPHYLDQHPKGFNGETREQRLQEFMQVNPDAVVVGLPEGTALKVIDNRVEILGEQPVMLFRNQQKEVASTEALNHLLELDEAMP
ncbi:MAG: dipeptidase PepE [Gammaproteobacteria bacterium]|nr:dipeptidase PepE [Gammaproteobacteria bacterium]